MCHAARLLRCIPARRQDRYHGGMTVTTDPHEPLVVDLSISMKMSLTGGSSLISPRC